MASAKAAASVTWPLAHPDRTLRVVLPAPRAERSELRGNAPSALGERQKVRERLASVREHSAGRAEGGPRAESGPEARQGRALSFPPSLKARRGARLGAKVLGLALLVRVGLLRVRVGLRLRLSLGRLEDEQDGAAAAVVRCREELAATGVYWERASHEERDGESGEGKATAKRNNAARADIRSAAKRAWMLPFGSVPRRIKIGFSTGGPRGGTGTARSILRPMGAGSSSPPSLLPPASAAASSCAAATASSASSSVAIASSSAEASVAAARSSAASTAASPSASAWSGSSASVTWTDATPSATEATASSAIASWTFGVGRGAER